MHTVMGGQNPPPSSTVHMHLPGPADPPPSEYWYCFDLVRIEFVLSLLQKLAQIIEYCLGNESQTFGKMDFNTFVKN